MKKTLIALAIVIGLSIQSYSQGYSKIGVTISYIPLNKHEANAPTFNFLPWQFECMPIRFSLYGQNELTQFYVFGLRYGNEFKTEQIGNVYGFDLLDCNNHSIYGTDILEFTWNKSNDIWLTQSFRVGFFVEIYSTWAQDTSGNTIGWNNAIYQHANNIYSKSKEYGITLSYRYSCFVVTTNISKYKVSCNIGLTLPVWMIFEMF